MAKCELELEFDKLKELTETGLNESQECPLHEKCVSDESFIGSSAEAIGDADQCAHLRRFKDVENEVGFVWLEIESDVRKLLEIQTNESQYNLEKDSESMLIVKDILDDTIAVLYMFEKSSKLNKYATIFNSATSGIRRSFGIHDLHRRIINKSKKTPNTEKTTVELTTSNPDFNTVVQQNKESTTEDMNEIELSEVEISLDKKARTLDRDTELTSMEQENTRDDKKRMKKSRSFVQIKKWFTFMDIFKRRRE